MRPSRLLSTFACLVSLAACGKQSEGERCDTSSGNLDCESGLICRSGDQLSLDGRGVGLCCPPDGVAPSVNACRAGADLPDELPPDEPALDAGQTGDAG